MSASPRPMRFDIVSDVVCPWCYIGLAAFERALAATADVVTPDVVFHPLQLNPGLPPEGETIAENVARKYGVTIEQARERGGTVRAAAADVGLAMAGRPDRLYDTFDAHRLLHWARADGGQWPLKKALFTAYFEQGRNVSDSDVLTDVAAAAGLDRSAAREVIDRGRFAADVADDEIEWRSEGVSAVPTVVVDRAFTIGGAQSPDRLERAIRRLAAR